MKKQTLNGSEKKRIDWMITLVPFFIIMAIAVLLFVFPDHSNDVIARIRFFFGDTLGIYYVILGIGILLVSLFLSFSKYGNASALRRGLTCP